MYEWNGSGFDLPVLNYRMLANKISSEIYFDTGENQSEFKECCAGIWIQRSLKRGSNQIMRKHHVLTGKDTAIGAQPCAGCAHHAEHCVNVSCRWRPLLQQLALASSNLLISLWL